MHFSKYILSPHFHRLCFAVDTHMISSTTLPLSGSGENCVEFFIYYFTMNTDRCRQKHKHATIDLWKQL